MKSTTKHTFEIVLVTATVLALALLPLAADAKHHRQGPPFEQMDADGDGAVSEAEFTDFRAERMAQRAAEGHQMQHAASAPTFADIDADGDGKLTREELVAVHEQRMARMHGSDKGHGGMHGGGRRMASFEDIDTDGDGCISREELDRHHQARHGSPD